MYDVADGAEGHRDGDPPRRSVVLDEEGVTKGTGARIVEGGGDTDARAAVGEEEVVELVAAEVR